jgi:uncharacterized protein (DUF3820 family)
MTDNDLMPFGKYKSTKMSDVPAKYLLWLWDNGVHADQTPLHNYIKRSFSALESECKDYIVQHRPK